MFGVGGFLGACSDVKRVGIISFRVRISRLSVFAEFEGLLRNARREVGTAILVPLVSVRGGREGKFQLAARCGKT